MLSGKTLASSKAERSAEEIERRARETARRMMGKTKDGREGTKPVEAQGEERSASECLKGVREKS